MNAYERRRRIRPLVYLLCVVLGLPPQVFAGDGDTLAVNRRVNALTHDSAMETFRNPQISSAAHNRFLYATEPQSLLGGGGDSFTNPGTAGAGGWGEPDVLWLANEGDLEWFDSDVYVPGVGLPLIFARVYRGSVSDYEGPLGDQWEFNWNKRLYEAYVESAADDVTFFEMGRFETYDESGGSYTSPAGRYDTLAKDTAPDPDEFTRTDKSGIQETFEFDADDGSVGKWYRLAEIRDLNDNTLSFAYDDDGMLTKVTDTLARDTTLAFDANSRITKITDSDSRDWVYGYDGGGLLTTVRTPTVDETGTDDDYTSGKTTTYKYDGSNQLTEVLRPDDSSTGTWTWAYDGSGRITTASKGGDDLTIAYDGSDHVTRIDDRGSVRTDYEYDGNDQITKRKVFYDATNSWDTTYSYDSDDEVTEVVFPKGNRIAYTYDSDGNILTVDFKEDADDTTPIRWIYTYADNARLSTLTDPEGNAYDFDYDGSSNLTKKTWPAVTLPSGIATADKNGNSTYDGTIAATWVVNSSGQPTSTTDPIGTTTSYEYTTVNSKSAYLQRVISDSGGGNLNLTKTYAYDGVGNVTSFTDPEGNATTYTVNDLNQVILAAEPGSVTRKTHYDLNDRVTKTEASNDSDVGDSWYTVTRQYDQVDNLTKTIADVDDTATRLTTAYDFDDNDRLTKVTSPEGNETVYSYDKRDMRTGITRKAAAAANDAITTITYDTNGNRVTAERPRGSGYDTAYSLDGYDRVTKIEQPERNYTVLELDENSNVTKRTSKNVGGTTLAETTYHFDEANRLYQSAELAKKADLSTNLGDGTKDEIVWRDEMGRVLEYTGDICGCSNYAFVYDAVGRRVTTKDPMGATDATRNLVVTEFDKNSNVTKTTREERSQDTGIEANKDIETTLVYDARDRLITRKELIATSTYAETVYHYGKRDQVTKVVDGEADEVRTEYNEQLWRTKVTAENGSADVVTEYTYDDDGLLVTYRAKNATTGDQDTIYAYDKLDRVVTTTWPDTDTHIYTYDKNSNRISTTDPNGTVIDCAYDKNDRLTSKTITLGTDVLGPTAVTFAYDGLNRRTDADTDENSNYDTKIDWTYNTLNKIETETQIIDGYNSGNGRTITYDWDVEGQKTGVTYPVSGDVVSYTRDDLDRVDKISRGSTEIVDYAFNGKRVIEKEMPGSKGLYTYDLFGRLTQIHHKDTSSGNTLAKFVYAYDDAHQVTSQDKYFYDDVENTRISDDVKDKGDQYAYDGAKRLVTTLRGVPSQKIGTAMATNITNGDFDDKVEYHYDSTGNRNTREIDDSNDVTYAYDEVNQMTTEGGTTQSYYDNGTYKGPASTKHKYDYEDRYAWWEKTGSLDFTWHYDALGRRVARTKAGTGNPGDTREYYDGVHQIESVAWSGSAESAKIQRVYGETIDELLEHINLTPNPVSEYYVHADRLRSIMLVVEDDGDIAESYRYTDFGETTVLNSSFVKQTSLGSGVANWHRYTARERALPGSFGDDWYFYRARVSRPDAGRFVQRDPVFLTQGNLYNYVGQRPLTFIDPSGLFPGSVECEAKVENGATGGPPGNPCQTSLVMPGDPSVPVDKYTSKASGGMGTGGNGDMFPGACSPLVWTYGWGMFVWYRPTEPCRFSGFANFHLLTDTCPPGFAGDTIGPGPAVGPLITGFTVSILHMPMNPPPSPTGPNPVTQPPPVPIGTPVSGGKHFPLPETLKCGQFMAIQYTWHLAGGAITGTFIVSCGKCPNAFGIAWV